MLRFRQSTDAKAGYHYFGKSDAGLDAGGLRKEVGGLGAELLGLSKEPDFEQFKRLLHGLDPYSGNQLTAKLQDDRIAYWDITASIPKRVTAAIEGGDERVHELLWDSGRRAMGDIEKLSTTRMKGGREGEKVTGNMIWYGFEHPETRPVALPVTHAHKAWDDLPPGSRFNGLAMPDMDRHIHFVVPNLTNDAEETQWKSIRFRPIMELRKYFSTRFDHYMSSGMANLGYEVETKYKAGKYYTWDIKGMPESVVKKFSRRSQEVEQAEERTVKANKKRDTEKGLDPSKTPDKLSKVARDKLGATSRLHKRDDMTLADYREYWNSRITPEERRKIKDTIRRAVKGLNPKQINTAEHGVAFSLEHHSHRQSVFEQKRREVSNLWVTAMERSMGGATPEDIDREFVRQGLWLKNKDGFLFGPDQEATTLKVYGEECKIRDFAVEGKGACKPVMTGAEARREIAVVNRMLKAEKGFLLTDEQQAALLSFLTSTDAVNILDAGQGTGKTEVLGPFGRILDKHQVHSTWLGVSHTAVDQLKEVGRPAMTVRSFLMSEKEKRKAAGGFIIIDEHSMWGHADAYELFTYAKENGCRIFFSGDTKQYKSPAAGDPVSLLKRFADVVPVTMTKTMRQQGKLKDAMETIRDGDVLKGHDMLNDLGMVHELPAEELTQRAADLYLEWTANGSEVPLVSPTHEQADDIAARIRDGLRAAGKLKGKDRTVRRLRPLKWSPPELREAKKHGAEGVTLGRYDAYHEDTQQLAVGDLVKTTMCGRTKDGKKKICNGQRYTIQAFTDTDDPILSNGWVVDKNWGGLVQGYVRTGQGAQGVTADPRSIVVYSMPSLVATRTSGFYVPVSRPTKEIAVLTDSNEALREAIQREEAKKPAMELMEQHFVEANKMVKPRFRDKAKAYVKMLRDRFRRLQENVIEYIPSFAPHQEMSHGIKGYSR